MDRAATVTITLGGLLIIVAVFFIFLFILREALPLLRPAEGHGLGLVSLGSPAAAKPLVVGIDEYQKYVYGLFPDGSVSFFAAGDGRLVESASVPSLAGANVVSGSRSASGDLMAAGTNDGRVVLLQVRFLPVYEQQRLVDLKREVRERGSIEVDARKRPVREVSYLEQDETKAVAALVGDDEIVLARISGEAPAELVTLRANDGERFTRASLGRTAELVAGTDRGHLYHWQLTPEPHLTEVVTVAAGPVTAIEYLLGGSTILVGDERGNVAAWFGVRLKEEDTETHLVQAHVFPAQGASVLAIGASPRDRSFVTAGADGSLLVRYPTSERTLLRLAGDGQELRTAQFTARGDGLLALRGDGRVARFEVKSAHPEFSWNSLFGKVWYEGYTEPEYVWQSTGGTDDFESKFSLVPLVFGTLKATLYALLFALPVAILGALYTSQFAHPSIKARIKPAVEIMAALPSVVVGFVAGLWLASRVETAVVPVLLMVVLLPLFGTSGFLLWDRLPRELRRRLRPGSELALILPLMILGACAALLLGPAAERLFFAGDFKHWVGTALGLVYDQRNSLVVGLAMGFAVIPIIFTISEDAFSSVPAHLTAASLALGASRWQTATRVVLPTASPGIFSAVMIGFGRAIGETMIVLMATGNTPVMDWSIFNGMRTLAANIAVEVPEAPYGGTLYRTLFLAALLLFVLTFIVNTAAELVRQRLRERYRAI
jgi:phosphate transport system permease protein